MASKTPKPRPYYNYQSLPTVSIRLVQTESISVPSDDPKDDLQDDLNISLPDYLLLRCPDNVAPSYTWGEANSINLGNTKPQISTQETPCGVFQYLVMEKSSWHQQCSLCTSTPSHEIGAPKTGPERSRRCGRLEIINHFGCTELIRIDDL